MILFILYCYVVFCLVDLFVCFVLVFFLRGIFFALFCSFFLYTLNLSNLRNDESYQDESYVYLETEIITGT
jgi:hypothetical protein